MFKTALIIGRFQPFHFGHLHLLREALRVADQVIIAVGSSNVTNEDNPFSYEQRRQMLEAVILEEGWQPRVKEIFPLPDFPSDQAWLDQLVESAGEFDLALGNNDWTNGVLSQAGYQVLPVPFWQREDYEGVQIRQMWRAGDERWRERVPEPISDLIPSFS